MCKQSQRGLRRKEYQFETEMSVAVKRSRRTSRTQSAVVPLATAASAIADGGEHDENSSTSSSARRMCTRSSTGGRILQVVSYSSFTCVFF